MSVAKSLASSIARQVAQLVSGSGSDNGGPTSPWGTTITLNDTLADVTWMILPSVITISSELSLTFYSRNNGSGIKVTIADNGINLIEEGEVYESFMLSRNADATSGVAAKAIAGNTEYYNLESGTAYAEWNYSELLDPDGFGLYFYRGGTNGIAEIIRVRSAVETVLGEIDLSVVTTGAGNQILSLAIAKGSFVSGDKIRVRSKAGTGFRVRLQAVVLYDTTSTSLPYWGPSFSPITRTSSPSSLEWAYQLAPSGETLVYVGNSAHQDSGTTEQSRVVTVLFDGVSSTGTRGLTSGTVEIERAADIEYDATVAVFASYAMTTSWTVSGLKCSHEITFSQNADTGTLNTVMWPGFPENTLIYIDGTEYDPDVTLDYPASTQALIGFTNASKFAVLVVPSAYISTNIPANNNKFYYQNTSNENAAYTPGQTITESWSIGLGYDGTGSVP